MSKSSIDSPVEVFESAVSAARRYAASVGDGPVGPGPDQLDALARLAAVDLDHPLGDVDAIALLDEVGSPATMKTTGGRYFGFVNGGLHPAARAAAVLAGTWDQNAALATMSPVAAALDGVVARWLVDLLDLPAGTEVSLCGGATVANLTAVLTARNELLGAVGWDVAERGLFGAPPISVILGAETHTSALKALRLAGFGRQQWTLVPTDADGLLAGDAVARAVTEVQSPVLVMTQAGNVNTGASDPFDRIVDALEAVHGPRTPDSGPSSWVHVDGAFGLWANASDRFRAMNAGVERADSWAADGHKFVNTPYDCGLVACADGAALRRAMEMSAVYASPVEGRRDPMNLGLQMSQAARAVPLWAVLATEGRAGMARRVEQACDQAAALAGAIVDGSVGRAEVLAAGLNQALIAFSRPDGTDITDPVVAEVQRSQVCWMGPTRWKDRRAMRISVSSFATTDADIEASAQAVLAALDVVSTAR